MGKIKVTQVKSAIKKPLRQKRTLEALGISRLHQTIEVEATPQILGPEGKPPGESGGSQIETTYRRLLWI
jgi:large subunit ribosomal protein L30